MRYSVLALLLAAALAACGGDIESETVEAPEGNVPSTASDTTAAPSTETTAETPAPSTTAAATTAAEGCADVVGVEISQLGTEVYRFDVTVSSADTGWDKYADAWEVRAPDGTVLGTRELAHPHVDEQPFTRSLSGVEIPSDVQDVTVAARDSVEGFCGAEMTVEVG